MKKQIWIMNHYAGNTYFDHSGRHYSFAKYLKRAGYEPVVFCCNAKHGKPELYFEDKVLWHEHLAEEIHVPFVFVAARTYTGNGRQRVLNMIDFYRNVKKTAIQYAKSHARPNVIYASSVHPLTLLAGIQLAKHFHIKCVCEVRDLWPESIVAYSKRLTKRNPFVRLLYKGEKWLYKKADKLIFTMEGGWDYICERGWNREIPRDKVFHINNGVDLEVFNYNRDHNQIQDSDLEDSNTFKVIYAGSIRKANNVGFLLDAAKKVTNPKIKFLLWGTGDELPALQQRVAKEKINNVIFKGRVEKKYVPYIVSQANLNIIHIMKTSLIAFGISPNKLFDYFAAGKPVLIDVQSKYNPVEQFSCGLIGETLEELAQNIQENFASSEEVRAELCENSLAAAKEYDFKTLTQKLITIIEEKD